MAGTIKGMTIEIGGNTAPLEKALKDTNKEINSTQRELKEVNKLLKFDPTNTELLKQKQQLLGQQISQTTTKLDALKQAQAKLDAEIKKGGNVNQEEYRKLQREIASAESSLDKLNKEAKECNPQLIKVKEALKGAGEAAASAAKMGFDLTVAGMKAMATAATAAITAVGGLAIKAGQAADDLNTLAATTGLSTKELQEFQYASDLIDVSVDTLAGALKKTTSSMVAAKDGTGKQAEAFKQLGVEIKNADGSLRDNNDVFNDAIKALGNIGNETERDAIAMQLFGKSATELNPLIEGGIDVLKQMSEQANELGLILSQEALDGANAFNDQIDILKANGQKTFQVIGTEVASQLAPAMESLNGYVNQVIKSLTTAMSEGGLEGLVVEVSNQIGQIITKITEKLPKIAELGVKIVKTLVNAIKENASQIGSGAAELITTLIEGFYEILPDLVETAVLLITSFISTIGNKLPELIPVIIDGILRAIDAIVDNIDIIIDAGIKIVLGLIDGIVKALPKLVEKIPEIIMKLANAIIENLPTILEAVVTVITSIVNAIVDNITTILPAIVQTIIAIAMAIIDHLPEIIDAVITVILAVVDALIDNIDKLIEGGIKLTIALAEGLIEAIPKLVERLPEIIMAIFNGLLKLGEKLLELGANLLQFLGEGITNALSGLWEAITGIWEYISDTLSKAFEGIKNIGKNLIEGLWNGIKNAKDWLINKLKELCNSALDAIKDFFGIESPSRVMADQVGKYMAQGIGTGFAKTMPSVISAMQDKLAGVTDAFQTELSFGDIPQIQGNQVISENQYITRNYTNTVETIRQPQAVELILDGTKVARTLIPSLDSERNRLGLKV